MLRKGTLHAREEDVASDGTYLAVTLINRPPHGVMAWAGMLRANAKSKPASEIVQDDYAVIEKVSFSRWPYVWDYFAERKYAALIATLRTQVEALYPGE